MANLYADFTLGDEGNAGTIGAPLKYAVGMGSSSSGKTLAGDDFMYLKRGEGWRETLTPAASGSAGHIITYAAYGAGVNPIINGSDIFTGWTDGGSNIWHKHSITTAPRVVYYNGVRLVQNSQLPTAQNVDLFDETFEGAGYATAGWSENSTPDEDADTAEVGSPSDWGAQCLKIVSPDNTDINSKKTLAANQAITYTRFEFILTANTISDYLDVNRIAQAWTDAYGTAWQIWLQRADLGDLKFLIAANYDGSLHYYNSICPCYMNRKYRIEVKWDYTNSLWAWRINGIDQPNNVDSTSPVTSEGTMSGSPATHVRMLSIGPKNGGGTYKSLTIYYDNIGMSASAWVGQPLGTLGSNEWYWASDTLYVNVGEDPETHDLEAGQRDYPLVVNGKDYITVEDIDLRLANHSAAYINDSSNLTFDGGEWEGGGFYGTDTPGAPLSSYVTFINLTVHGFGSSGINISADADYWDHCTISHNTIYDNGWQFIHSATATMEGNSAGIKVWGGKNFGAAGESDYVTVEYNEVYGNYDQWGGLCGTGIWVDQWGDGAIVRYNNVHNNDNAGIVFENMDGGVGYYNLVYSNLNGIMVYRGATTQEIYNNVCYGNERAGLRCSGIGDDAMIDNLFQNNISTENGKNLAAIAGGDNTGNGSGNVYEYNCLGPEAAKFIEWGQYVFKSTYDDWETAYGGTTHSIEDDPLMIDPDNGDFHLHSSSPCINAGIDVSLTNDYVGNPVSGVPDIGAYEYTASNDVTKRWTGAAWNNAKVMVYVSGSWQSRPIKHWTGTDWVDVDGLGN